jgi:hypothetical protein
MIRFIARPFHLNLPYYGKNTRGITSNSSRKALKPRLLESEAQKEKVHGKGKSDSGQMVLTTVGTSGVLVSRSLTPIRAFSRQDPFSIIT